MNIALCILSLLILFAGGTSAARAQNSSLYRQEFTPIDDRQGPAQMNSLTLANTSFMYQRHLPQKELKINDQLMVTVSEKSQVLSKGDMNAKRKGNINASIKDWVKFKGFSVHPDPMTEGDPKVNGSLDSEFKANTELKTQDSMSFRIACTIVDVRPNGKFVIEGHRTVQDNEETWEQSLTGIVSREDVLPNKEVKSERIAELKILKRETGHVRDGYRRGWLTKFWDTVSPF